MKSCTICGAGMKNGLAPWHYACPACGFEGSALLPAINEVGARQNRIDESARLEALCALRRDSAKIILDKLAPFIPPGPDKRILDVGCAYGWFMVAARDRGYEVTGLEPDTRIADLNEAQGCRLYRGFFPVALEEGDRFDVILFSDVFEHLQDIPAMAAGIAAHLKPGGMVIINGPSRRGFFYSMSKLLYRLGWTMPFERMWQKDYPSPHLSYFVPGDIARLFDGEGFKEILRFEMPSIRLHKLWRRLAYDTSCGMVQRLCLYVGTLAAWPLLRLFPSDNVAQFFRK